MFLAFPASSSAHTTDEGVFCGPRPEFYLCSMSGKDIIDDSNNEDVKLIKNLITVNDRLIVLTPESNLLRLNTILEYPAQVLGIRQSKGLEFSDVLLVDFFCSLPKDDFKAWRLLLDSDHVGEGDNYPQLESQLKLLYVAITRACNRLIFIETKPSGITSLMIPLLYIFIQIKLDIATRMFKFWTYPTPLISRYKPDTEKHDLLTGDELVKRGLDFILIATDLDKDDSAEQSKVLSWLEKSLYYFKRAGRNDLMKRVILQQRIVRYNHRKDDRNLLELDKIEAEHNQIGLIYDCMINDMHNEALRLMMELNVDDSRYLNELVNKFKSIIPKD